MHDIFMGNVTVGKMYFVNLMFLNKISELRFRINRYTPGIELPGQSSRIFSAFNIRNLSSSKSNYPVIRIVAKIDIKIVKIAACSSHDNNFSHF